MIIAGLTVLSKLDMKKIIAYSKSIRCYIFLGSGGVLRCVHLIRHAYFKAIIFMWAGAIIYSMSGVKSLEKYIIFK